jgi:hypothetical protein
LIVIFLIIKNHPIMKSQVNLLFIAFGIVGVSIIFLVLTQAERAIIRVLQPIVVLAQVVTLAARSMAQA